MALKYRPNVAGILQRPKDGRILIGERADVAGAWQFPQGGIDRGESAKQALFREMEEEIGLKRGGYEILGKRDGYRYKFPKNKPTWGKYRGQEQTYFHCLLRGDESSICLDKHNQEFSDYCWIRPEEFDIEWLPEFKRDVYARVLHDFFGIR